MTRSPLIETDVVQQGCGAHYVDIGAFNHCQFLGHIHHAQHVIEIMRGIGLGRIE